MNYGFPNNSWLPPARRQTPPGAAPHFRGPYTCEMAVALPLKLGNRVPDRLYAALLARRPDADGTGYLEVGGSVPRIPVTLIGHSSSHFAIPHALLFEVPPQDVQSLGLFESPEPSTGRLFFYGAPRAVRTQYQPESQYEFPAFSVLVRRPPIARLNVTPPAISHPSQSVQFMTESNIIPFADHQVRNGLPAEYPFEVLVPGCIVMLGDQLGLYEALEPAEGRQFTFRALSEEGLPLVKASPEDVRSFNLPIFFCVASRHRGEIVAVVSGEHYDVTLTNAPEVAAPVFQQVHARALIEFMALASAAGFSAIELSNGHEAYEAEIVDLIAECQAFCANANV